MSKILVTGATGFIGSALVQKLSEYGNDVLSVMRKHSQSANTKGIFFVDRIDSYTDWEEALSGVDIVIHLAAIAHQADSIKSPLLEYRKVNTEGTINLARQAADAGVKRFIYISTIKVNGESTSLDKPYQAEDTPSPKDAYGVSKMEAERGLLEISRATRMEVVCIRPPLVYGPGVKGNFLSLLRWLGRGVPLPLGAIHNHRSLVGLDNLVDLIITCMEHHAAANQILLVSDDEDLSTTELLRRLSKALDKPTRLLPVPPGLLQWGAKRFGKDEIAQRLLGNLQLDISYTKECLNWEPPVSVDEGFKKTAEWYRKQR